MSRQKRRQFAAEFKAKVALNAVIKEFTLAELSQNYDLSPVVIAK